MERRKIKVISVTSTVLFALSAILIGVSQNQDNKATDSLITTIIAFESSAYVGQQQVMNQQLLTLNFLVLGTELSKRNLMCSYARAYEDSAQLDQQLLTMLQDECFNITLKSNLESIDRTMNQADQLQNLSKHFDPLKDFSKSAKTFVDAQKSSDRWWFAGFVAFMLGIIGFYVCLLECLFDKRAIRGSE